jgi:hypothetical protein
LESICRLFGSTSSKLFFFLFLRCIITSKKICLWIIWC